MQFFVGLLGFVLAVSILALLVCVGMQSCEGSFSLLHSERYRLLLLLRIMHVLHSGFEARHGCTLLLNRVCKEVKSRSHFFFEGLSLLGTERAWRALLWRSKRLLCRRRRKCPRSGKCRTKRRDSKCLKGG